jgi:threonylcarbamoyladenosine tRNA methylthiotransferase CDKAL1
MTKVSFTTLGCSANQAETEIMSGILSEKGYILVDKPQDSDIAIINICTVKGDKTAINNIKEVQRKVQRHTRLVIAGCIPPTRDKVFREVAPYAAFVKTDNITKIGEVVEELLKDNPLSLMTRNDEIKINLPSKRQNKNIAIIPINNSCNDACSFCGVKLIKGKLLSYPEEQILKNIKKVLAEGTKEIWITSQDTGAYGIDTEGKCLLPKLINKITAIPVDFKLRVGMFNPMNIVDVEKELLESYKHPKVFKFAHIPLQAGSNKILRSMKRRYTKEQFINLIKLFRKIPNLTFATDIIVGFPGETEEDFQETIEVCKLTKPEVMHISRFQEIPNTAATLLKNKIHPRHSKERSRSLTKIRYEIAAEQNKKWLNQEFECIVVDINETKGDFIAHNESYLQVIIRSDLDLLGKKVKVRITETDKHYLIGELLNIIEEEQKIILKI